jgi:hypothetical protein
MIEIVRITKNPKRKKRPNKIFGKKRPNKIFGKKKRTKVTLIVKNPKRKTLKTLSRVKIIPVKRNPVRKTYQTMIVGYAVERSEFYGRRKTKRYYFTGNGFSKKKDDAKIFQGDGAKMEAKRIQPLLPMKILKITVETV